jgi:DNA-binding protein YbaB
VRRETVVDVTQEYDEHARSTRETDYIASIGEGADGIVRIELDGAGRLWDVVLDPQVTELSAEELRTALFDAISAAQAGVPAPDFEASVAEVNTAAERRFAEISEALHDLSRRAARR